MRTDAAGALRVLGFEPFKDFTAAHDGAVVSIVWLSGLPMPTEAQIDAVDLSPAAQSAREDAKEPLLADIKAQAQAATDTIDTYVARASPTAAQNTAFLKALGVMMKFVIKALARLAVRTWR